MYKPVTKKFYVYVEGFRKPSAITAIDREEALRFAAWMIDRTTPGAQFRVTAFRGNPWKHIWLARPTLVEWMRIDAEANAQKR